MNDRRCACFLVPAFLFLAGASALAQEERDMSTLITPEAEQRIEKGYAWLVANQNRDGSWGCMLNQAPSTAVTALACLALMSEGSTPDRGDFQKPIQKALRYILSVAQPTGAITANDVTGLGIVYDHAASVLLLAEIYGMDPAVKNDKDIRQALVKAIQYLGSIQNVDGGFSAQVGGTSDLPITAMAWNAIRAAHNAGVETSPVNLEKLLAFVKSCESSGGTFSQYAGSGDGGRMFYPTTAGLRVLVGMGTGDQKKVREGCEWMIGRQLGADYGGQISEWDYAGAFFGIQAVFHDRAFFDRWYPKMRDLLISIQNPPGFWSIQYCTCCRAYATAVALILLQAPKKILPMFQL